MSTIKSLFTNQGGVFCISKKAMESVLHPIKAFVFDWDGVFNNGVKNDQRGSTFSEIDAMGTNLLRFSRYLYKNQMPLTAIMSGEKNEFSVDFGQREHFHSIYLNVKNKITALNHFLKLYNLLPTEVVFVFDDVLDIALAKICGLRILVNRKGSPLLKKYVMDRSLADYVTAQYGGNHAVREVSELLMGIQKNYDSTIDHRVQFSSEYSHYLRERQNITTCVYSWNGENMVASTPT